MFVEHCRENKEDNVRLKKEIDDSGGLGIKQPSVIQDTFSSTGEQSCTEFEISKYNGLLTILVKCIL